MGMNHSMKTFVVLIAIVTSLYAERPFATQTVLLIVDAQEPSIQLGECQWDPDIKKKVATYFKATIKVDDATALKIADNFYALLPKENFNFLLENHLPQIINKILKDAHITHNTHIQKIQEYLHELPYKTKLDEKAGTILCDLYTALVEAHCIVIATSSIVNYLMRYLKEVSDNPLNISNSPKIDPRKWVAKKVTDYIYLFVPISYFSNMYNHSFLKQMSLKDKKYTLDEFSVGLKLEDKQSINDEDFMKPTIYRSKQDYIYSGTHYDSWLSQHITEHMETIFIPEKEYRKHLSQLSEADLQNIIPTKAVILIGHGAPYISLASEIKKLKKDVSKHEKEIERLKTLVSKGEIVYKAGSIGGFYPNDFGKFVNALSHIATKFLCIMTCYGSAEQLQHALDLIRKEKAWNTQSFSFPIVSGAFTESSIITRHVENNGVGNSIAISYKDFFDMLNSESIPSEDIIADALTYIYQFASILGNQPIIKKGDLPWRLLSWPEGIATISDLFARTYTKDILNVAKFFNTTELEVLALNTLNIPFMLNMIDLDEFPDVIPLIPGDTLYSIKALNAGKFDFSKVVRHIMLRTKLKAYKIFCIGELHVLNDLECVDKAAFKKEIILSDVVIYSTPEGKGIYFKYKEDFWYSNLNREDLKKFIAHLPQQKQHDGSSIIKFTDQHGKKITFTSAEIDKELRTNYDIFIMTLMLQKTSADAIENFLKTLPKDIKKSSHDRTFEKLMNVSLQKKMEDIKTGNVRYHTSTVDTFARALQVI